MPTKIEVFNQSQIKKDLPDIRPGDIVRVSKKEGEKIQTFEGQVLAKKHGQEIGATITVRRVVSGIGMEKIFPLHLPSIEKIEILKRGKARRAKLYYLRTAKGDRAKLKQSEIK